MDIIHIVYKQNPWLKRDILAAHMQISPYDFIKRSLQSSFIYACCVAFISLFPLARAELPLFFAVGVFCLVFFFIFNVQLGIPKSVIKRRAREIENEVLFAARFLLVKLSSGRPLFNALIETSQSYGAAAKYFKEIVDDINFGTPIEEALQRAMDRTLSVSFKKVIFQIMNALKIGVDVTDNLEIVVQEIEAEQALEIERYSKKLSSVALFYMLLAIVVPSLGMTLLIVLASLIGIGLSIELYLVMVIVIVSIQFFFMITFRKIRPGVVV